MSSLGPMLTRGSHRSRQHGMCVMEYASMLAGEGWTDCPRCTHPVLAAVARTVNDFAASTTRQQLAAEAPRLVGARGDDDSLSARIVILCALYASATAHSPALRPVLWHAERVLRVAERGRARGPAGRLLRRSALAGFDLLAINVYAPMVVRLMSRHVSPGELVLVLRGCLTLVEQTAGAGARPDAMEISACAVSQEARIVRFG